MNVYSYSTRLEDYSNTFLKELKKMLMTQTLVDVTLVCDSESIKVHKIVLVASSPYFREHLLNEKKMNIIFKSKFSIILSIVEFIYTGKTTYLESELTELVSAARLFKIDGLSDLHVNAENELPDYPPPIFMKDLYCNNEDYLQTNCTIGTMSVHSVNNLFPRAFVSFSIDALSNPNVNLTESSLTENDNCVMLQSFLTHNRKRGRPKKSENLNTLKISINAGIEAKADDSKKCFQYLEKLTLSEMIIEKDIELAVKSISDNPQEINDNDVCENVTIWQNKPEETLIAFRESSSIVDSTLNKSVDHFNTEFITIQEDDAQLNIPIYYKTSNGSLIDMNNDILTETQTDMYGYKIIEEFEINNKLETNHIKNTEDITDDLY